jgi:formate dehydrogenase (NADP+) beta subunit
LVELVFGVWGDRVVDRRQGRACDDDVIAAEIPGFEGLDEIGDFGEGNKILGLMGWDGFFVLDPRADPIDMAREYATVLQSESCGTCIPCSMGTRVAAEILTRIANGKGREEDLGILRRVAQLTHLGSMCELGHTGLNAVLKLLDHYEKELRTAISQGVRSQRGTYHAKLTAPCIEACPEHLDIPRYVEYIREGRYADSLDVIHERNPLAAVCGRVCVRFCEFACRRGQIDDPVDIKHLKRFVSDAQMETAIKPSIHLPAIAPDAERVAIIGAGPAGVTAAYHLLLKGYQVDILEAKEESGGMAAVGIPDYRLPRDVLRAELDVLREMGASIHYGQRLGTDYDLQDLRDRGYAAIFVAIGAQLGTPLRVKGEDRKPQGYMSGIDLLRRVNEQESIELGRKAVIVGGGNVAMDCSRSLLRLGVEEVHLVYRRDREAMPADAEEVHDAEEEGVIYHFLCNPVRLLIEEDRLVGAECIRMELGELDASGRRSPIPIAGSEFVIECDMVIPAIGQRVEVSYLEEAGLNLTRWGTLEVDPDTLQTNVEDIFAGGDCVSGPATLIEAMAAGLRASQSIDQYLRCGEVSLTEEERVSRIVKTVMAIDQDRVDCLGRGKGRRTMPMRSVAERIHDFNEVEIGLSAEEALLEADRCLRCYRIMLVATEH